MNSAESIDVVTRTLTICADTRGDIVPAIYERFFRFCGEANQVMGHSDQYVHGRMFEQVLELLMSDELFGPGGYLDWELDNHLDAYHVTPQMYEAFFKAVVQIVREGVGSAWIERDRLAWQSRVDLVMEQVDAHPARP